jgi:hypothetical protein
VVQEAVPFDFVEKDWKWDENGNAEPFFRQEQIIQLRAGEKENHLLPESILYFIRNLLSTAFQPIMF